MLTEKKRKDVLSKFMKMVAEQSWSQVDLQELANQCGIKYSALRGNYSDQKEILKDFMTMIDQEVLENISFEEDEDSSAKDRLFDILMARFDALKPYRIGIKQLLCVVKSDPCFALMMNKFSAKSMRWMLDGAKIPTRGFKGTAKVQGLVLIYSRVVCIWLNDEDKGLPKTMAALDRELNRGHILLKQVDRAENVFSNLCQLVCCCGKRSNVSANSSSVPV